MSVCMASSQVLSISSPSFISLVREMSVSQINVFSLWLLWYPHKSYKMQCRGGYSPKVFGVSKLLFSGLCWEYMERHSKVPFEGCAGALQDLPHWMCATWLSHNCSWIQSFTSGDPSMLCLFAQPWSPSRCSCPPPTSWAPQPCCSLLHHPPTASPSRNTSRIRPQDFFTDLAKLQILDGFNSKPGIWPDLLENGPSFIQTLLQTSTNRLWVLTFLWNLKPHVFHMV